MPTAPLDRITIEPKVPATSCVILLHGLGDSGDGFAPIVPELGLPNNHAVRFIFSSCAPTAGNNKSRLCHAFLV